jgi:hypothetical protein
MTFTRHSTEHLLIQLTPTEVHGLRTITARNPRGAGGFQGLLHALHDHLIGATIELTDPTLIERTIRYQTRYGDGGFQRRFGGRGRYGRDI